MAKAKKKKVVTKQSDYAPNSVIGTSTNNPPQQGYYLPGDSSKSSTASYTSAAWPAPENWPLQGHDSARKTAMDYIVTVSQYMQEKDPVRKIDLAGRMNNVVESLINGIQIGCTAMEQMQQATRSGDEAAKLNIATANNTIKSIANTIWIHNYVALRGAPGLQVRLIDSQLVGRINRVANFTLQTDGLALAPGVDPNSIWLDTQITPQAQNIPMNNPVSEQPVDPSLANAPLSGDMTQEQPVEEGAINPQEEVEMPEEMPETGEVPEEVMSEEEVPEEEIPEEEIPEEEIPEEEVPEEEVPEEEVPEEEALNPEEEVIEENPDEMEGYEEQPEEQSSDEQEEMLSEEDSDDFVRIGKKELYQLLKENEELKKYIIDNIVNNDEDVDSNEEIDNLYDEETPEDEVIEDGREEEIPEEISEEEEIPEEELTDEEIPEGEEEVTEEVPEEMSDEEIPEEDVSDDEDEEDTTYCVMCDRMVTQEDIDACENAECPFKQAANDVDLTDDALSDTEENPDVEETPEDEEDVTNKHFFMINLDNHEGHNKHNFVNKEFDGIDIEYCVDCNKALSYSFHTENWTLKEAKNWMGKRDKKIVTKNIEVDTIDKIVENMLTKWEKEEIIPDKLIVKEPKIEDEVLDEIIIKTALERAIETSLLGKEINSLKNELKYIIG